MKKNPMIRLLKVTAVAWVALFFLIYLGSWIHIRLGSSKEMLDIQNEDGSWDVEWSTEGPDVIPKNMIEAVAQLERSLSAKQLEIYKAHLEVDPEKLSIEERIEHEETFGHFGIGMSTRNAWGLWHGSRLARWLGWRVGWHADNMSTAILEEFDSHMRGNPVSELTGKRLFFLAFWTSFVVFPLFVLATFIHLIRKIIKKLSNQAPQTTSASARV